MMIPYARVVLLTTVALAGACARRADPPAPAASAAETPASPIVFDDAMSPAERSEFYHLAEGSEMLPVEWFFALENETDDSLYADHLERFNLIADAKSAANPFGLPVGLTSAETRDLRFTGVQMVGVTCAACHVSELTYQGRRVRLDGGSSHADVEAFSLGVGRALQATVESPAKFLRFIDRLRDRTTSEVLAADDAARSAKVFASTPALGGTPPASAFDRALHQGLTKLIERERDRPAIDLRANRPVRPGATVQAAAQQIRARLGEGLDAATLAQHAPTIPAGDSPVAAAVAPGDLDSSVRAFLSDAVVTLRLLKARLGLRTEMAALMRENTTVPGYGRIDAFGGFRLMLFGQTPIAAPVGFPDLWSLAKTKWIHWDANTTSVLERNIGQALGMGAVLDRRTMSSTVSLPNLHHLEELALKTRAPSWERVIGPIDGSRADRGEGIFKSTCASCHADGTDDPLPSLEQVGTDPNRAMSFAQPIGAQPFADALGGMLGRIKAQTFKDDGISTADQQAIEGSRPAAWRTTGRYPARPLVGVWASAPYLHNNSVPTLDDLLRPPAARPIMFFRGSVEYDALKMGFVTSQQTGSFMFDTRLPGNSNAGHTYGTELPDADRAALLEYLKRL